MRLTKLIKESFVRAVMNDTPAIDYDTMIRSSVTEWLKENTPKEIISLAKKHPEYFNTDDYLWLNGFGCIRFDVLPRSSHHQRDLAYKIQKALAELIGKKKQQDEARNTLKFKLEGTIEAFTTVKAAKAALPELAKYLPEDEEKAVKNLPAIANTIADLVAAGWPKGKAAA